MNKDNQSYLVVFDGSLLISKLTRYYYTGCLASFYHHAMYGGVEKPYRSYTLLYVHVVMLDHLAHSEGIVRPSGLSCPSMFLICVLKGTPVISHFCHHVCMVVVETMYQSYINIYRHTDILQY